MSQLGSELEYKPPQPTESSAGLSGTQWTSLLGLQRCGFQHPHPVGPGAADSDPRTASEMPDGLKQVILPPPHPSFLK